MTYHLRHHTTQAHIKAASSVPAFTLRNEPTPEGLEDWLAAKMRASAKSTPRYDRTKPNHLQERVAEIMADGRERTASDVRTALGLTGNSGLGNSLNALNALMDKGFVAREYIPDGKGNVAIFSLAHEPHVSCKDRIAAAVKEAAQ